MTNPLWSADEERMRRSHMYNFLTFIKSSNNRIENYDDLYQWSIDDRPAFWDALASFAGVIWRKKGKTILAQSSMGRISEDQWFPDWELNFAENLLRPGDANDEAIIGIAEGAETFILNRGQLRKEVAKVACWLASQGIQKGDCVAGVMENRPEAIIAMLASVSLGAIWSSCSPDFGIEGIIDRLGQIRPRCVFFTSSYQYGGKVFDCLPTAREVLKRLPNCEKMVLVPIINEPDRFEGLHLWTEITAVAGSEEPSLKFESVPFNHPLYIMFSSGTTGAPKCIVHGHGGTLLQHKKELLLHSDIGPESRLLYFTTCGWMMWNWMVSALGTGASLVTFGGAVSKPHPDFLWRTVGKYKVTDFGTSPKYISYCMNEGIDPNENSDLGLLRTILSTGSPLLPEHYKWVYRQFPNVHLASISGGTDIISCFMLGNPLRPVNAGEIQGAGLGMAIQAWDENGKSALDKKGELVCVKSFPSMPVCFWNDVENSIYRSTYFNYYQNAPEVWRHGDYVEICSSSGGIIVYGRSDATLNPGGVRIGTAEIYRQVERIPGVSDSLAVGVPVDGDIKIVLFVKLDGGTTLSQYLETQIRQQIREQLTPRHVPAYIVQVSDIPYTRSGKKVELAVTKVLEDEPIGNLNALANPEVLEEYRQIGSWLKDQL